MKKWLGIILGLVIISSVIFYGYQILHEAKVSSLESIVPEEAIFYIYSYNPDKKINDFQSSDFFKQFFASSVYQKFINPKINAVKQKIPFLPDFLQGDTALAIFSLANIEPFKRDFANFGDFLFLTRIDNKRQIKIRKSISDFYLLFAGKGQVDYRKYKGIKITSYKLPDLQATFSYALLSGVVIIGNNSYILEKSIDLFKNQSKSSLLNNKSFLKLASKIKRDSLLWIYGNTRRYYQEILREYAYNSLESKQEEGDKSAESLARLKPFVNLMNVLDAYISYLDYDELKTGFIFKSYHTLDRTMDEENILSVITGNKKADKDIFDLVPRYVISYCGGSYDFVKLWRFLTKFYASMDEIMRARMESDPRYYKFKDQIDNMGFENIIKKAESFLGVNIEKDIVSLLGNNFGLVFFGLEEIDIPLGGLPAGPSPAKRQSLFLPFPEVYSVIELKDGLKMQKVMGDILQRIVENANQFFREQERKVKEMQGSQIQPNYEAGPIEEKKYLDLRTEVYKDTNIYIIEMLDFPIDILRFNYCILDKYIIFSLFPMLTKNIIDIYKDKQGTFNSNYYFESAQAKISSDYSHIMFFNFRKMVDDIQATKFFAELQTRLGNNTGGFFLKEDLDSIFNVLKNINAFTFTNRMFDIDTMESSGYIKIEGL